MAIIVQDRFDGGLMGPRGMYRGSNEKQYAVKRLQNMEVRNEGSLHARDRLKNSGFETVSLEIPNRESGTQMREFDFSQPIWEGTRVLPFRFKGDRYALHYTPYHYLTFEFDTAGGRPRDFSSPNLTIGNADSFRHLFSLAASDNYTAGLDLAVESVSSSIYNQLYLQDALAPNQANHAILNWRKSTFLFNLYVVFREDGTVVRQGRPFHLRSVEPANGESITTTPNLIGVGGISLPRVAGRQPHQNPSGRLSAYANRDDSYIDGILEREAIFQNAINWDLIARYSRPVRQGMWHPLTYTANFTPNVNYEFLDLGDTFTFVDTMGTVLPDIVHQGQSADVHGIYTPLTTFVAGPEGMPFPYDGRHEIIAPQRTNDFSVARSGGFVESNLLDALEHREGPLTTPSFNAEKGEAHTLDNVGFPGRPVPPGEFSPGHLFFLYGQTSHQEVGGTTVADRYLENTHSMDIRFTSFHTNRPLTGELFFGYPAPRVAIPPIIRKEIVGAGKNILRVSTAGESASEAAALSTANRTTTTATGTTDATPLKRIGIISRRPSDVFVDNAPRMRLPRSANMWYPSTYRTVDSGDPFFHGPLTDGMKGFMFVQFGIHGTGTGDNPQFPPGFYIAFDGTAGLSFYASLERAVFRADDGVTGVTPRYLDRGDTIHRGSEFPSFVGVDDSDWVVPFTGGWIPFLATAIGNILGSHRDATRPVSRLELYTGEISEELFYGRAYWGGFHIDEYRELNMSVHFQANTAATRAVYLPGVAVNDRAFREQLPFDQYRVRGDIYRRAAKVYTRVRETDSNAQHTLGPRLFSEVKLNAFPGNSPGRTYDADADELSFNFRMLTSSLLNPMLLRAITYEPTSLEYAGPLPASITFRVPGTTTDITESSRYRFPFIVTSTSYLYRRIAQPRNPFNPPPRYIPVDVRAYYSTELIRQAATADADAVPALAGRIGLRRPDSDDLPIPIHLDRDIQSSEEAPVLAPDRNDFLAAIPANVPLPRNWEYYAGRLFWFGQYSFGASEPFVPSNFNSYRTENVENPPLDNLLGISGDDRVLWTEVYEGNLVIGLRDEMQQFRAGVSIVPSTIPTILARYPGTEVQPVVVRNFLFKVSEDLRSVEMIAPRFQYAEKFVAEVVTDKVALDYFQDATIVRLTNHPEQHGFFVDLSDGRVLYAYVYREGTVAWSEMIYPGKGVETLQSNPLGVFFATAAVQGTPAGDGHSLLFPQVHRGGQELHFLSGTGDFLEDTLTCETELLPLSLLGRPMSARLNESAHQADTSVIVDMPLGEQLGIGKGEEVRTRISYNGGEIRTSYREGSEGDDGLLLRYTGSAPFRILRVARQDGPIQPGQIFPERETRHRKRLGRVEL